MVLVVAAGVVAFGVGMLILFHFALTIELLAQVFRDTERGVGGDRGCPNGIERTTATKSDTDSMVG